MDNLSYKIIAIDVTFLQGMRVNQRVVKPWVSPCTLTYVHFT
jgi:hypothetical protein